MTPPRALLRWLAVLLPTTAAAAPPTRGPASAPAGDSAPAEDAGSGAAPASAEASDAPADPTAPANTDPNPADPNPADPNAPPPELPDDELPVLLITSADGRPSTPGSAWVITQEDLQRQRYDDVHRVLAAVPGVYVRGEDGFGLRPNIGIRGASSDRSAKLTLLEDGVLFAPGPYAAPAAYWFPLMQHITGVEVVKGAASVRFGPQTVGGAINLLSRPAPEATTAGFDASVGLRESVRLTGYAGTGAAGWGFLVEGTHVGTGGFKQLDTGGPTGFVRQELRMKTALRTGDHVVQLKVGYSRERSHETYLGLTPSDAAATPYRRYAASALDLMTWRHLRTDLSWRVASDAIDVTTVLYHRWLSRAWTKLNRFDGGPDLHDLLRVDGAGQAAIYQGILRGEVDSTAPEHTLLIGTNDRTFHAMGAQSTLVWRISRGIVDSRLEAGVRLHVDLVDRLHTEDPHQLLAGNLVRTAEPTRTLLDNRSTALAASLHVHEDLGLGPVRVLPGVRVEIVRTTSLDAGASEVDARTIAVPLPGLGVHATVAPTVDVFAGVHRGFSPLGPGSDPNAKPESSWNLEAGVRAAPRRGQIDLVGFYNAYGNLTGTCTQSAGCDETAIGEVFAGGTVDIWGAEASWRQAVPLPAKVSLDLLTSYTLTQSRFRTAFSSGFPQFGDVEVGDGLAYVPAHQAAVQIAADHPWFSLALSGTARSAMRDEAGQGRVIDGDHVPFLAQLDLSGAAHLSRHVDATVNVTNLTNTAVAESMRPFGIRPVAPLQVWLGVRLRTPD